MVRACFILREELCARIAFIDSLSAPADRRQLVGARDTELRLRLQDSRCRNANIVVLPESSVEQVLQLFVLEDPPPLLLSERFRRRLRCLLRRSSAVHTRNVYARPPIIRPHSAARTQEQR